KPFTSADQVNVEVLVDGEPVRSSVRVEMNLLRIGQEAVTNAVKHAQAKNITLTVQFRPHRISLRITDDGRGFCAENVALSGNGHFGLLDMRERAQSLGSDLLIESVAGLGTRIEVEVALTQKEMLHGESQVHTHSGR